MILKRKTVDGQAFGLAPLSMHYEGRHIIRRPSEANSVILQVTVGCSHNKCTFCGTYKGERFRIKDQSVIDADIDFAARYCRCQNRMFLADGDVLILPQRHLTALLTKIKARAPWINRISLYGNAKSILKKKPSELEELKSLGLDRIYMGLESGHDPTLKAIIKGADKAAMVEAGRKVRKAGLFLSVTVLLGIAGVLHSLAHAEATGAVLSDMAPNQIGVLTLMLLDNTPLYRDAAAGRFQLPGPLGMLEELRMMVENIHLDRVQLQTNHASNYLTLNARLSRDKEQVLGIIDQAITGNIHLKAEALRAL